MVKARAIDGPVSCWWGLPGCNGTNQPAEQINAMWASRSSPFRSVQPLPPTPSVPAARAAREGKPGRAGRAIADRGWGDPRSGWFGTAARNEPSHARRT